MGQSLGTPDGRARGIGAGVTSRLVRLALTAALLALLWHVADGRNALAQLLRADPWWLAVAFVALSLQVILSALRWRVTAAQLGQTIGVCRAIREYYLAQLLNQTLPGGVVGDAGRAVRARHQAGLLRASLAVVVERSAGQVALLAVMLAGFAMAPVFLADPPWPAWVSPLAIVLSASLIGLALAVRAVSRRPNPILPWLSAGLAVVHVALLARSVWPQQVGLSLAIVALNLGAFAAAAQATGTTLPVLAVVTMVPVILTAMLLPFTVAGWGAREAAAAALWPLFGGAADAGLAASIAFGLMVLAASLPGALVLLRRHAVERTC